MPAAGKRPTAALALARGNAAVVTGGASGIGLALARALLARGLHVAVADVPGARLDAARDELVAAAAAAAGDGAPAPRVLAVGVDVASADDVARLAAAARAWAPGGAVDVLVCSAGIQPGSRCLGGGDAAAGARFDRVLAVNYGGVERCCRAFADGMLASGRPCAIVNVGSKQGITCPPGDPAYNISKVAVKTFTEALEHELRSAPGQVSAHLLIPGFVWTPLTYGGRADKPAGAWLPEQTAAFCLAGLEAGTFYMLSPDNDVSRALDERRIAWAAGDIIADRPPLSRWHPDYSDAFKESIKDL